MAKIDETITFDGEEVQVIGYYYKACRGARERGTGLQLSPDDPENIEINEVIFKGVDIINFLDVVRVEKRLIEEMRQHS